MAALAYRAVAAVERLLGGDPLEEQAPVPIPAARTTCGECDDTGFVVTHEDGGAGYRPCFRCPREGDAA